MCISFFMKFIMDISNIIQCYNKKSFLSHLVYSDHFHVTLNLLCRIAPLVRITDWTMFYNMYIYYVLYIVAALMLECMFFLEHYKNIKYFHWLIAKPCIHKPMFIIMEIAYLPVKMNLTVSTLKPSYWV